MNKKSGKISGKIQLNNVQKEEVFSGKASLDKKNAYVHGEIIEDSGIANYIYIAKGIDVNKDVFNNLISISQYAIKSDIYFACKALNYRVDQEKWEGNRHLAVWVERKLVKNKLNQVINFTILGSVLIVTLIIKFIHLRYVRPYVSSLKRKYRNVRSDEKESDIRDEKNSTKLKSFNPQKYSALETFKFLLIEPAIMVLLNNGPQFPLSSFILKLKTVKPEAGKLTLDL